MLSYSVLAAAPAIYLVISTILSFLRNLRNAQKSGLPIVISPVDFMNPVWLVLQKPLSPLLAKLPFGLGSWVRYNQLSWYFDDKYAMHQEHGKVFIHVTPGMNELHSIDPEANAQILSRRSDFEKPDRILESVKPYGDSVTSVTGLDWQRHRRITVPPFNERNCMLVWDESLDQARQLALYWSSRGLGGTTPILDDTSECPFAAQPSSSMCFEMVSLGTRVSWDQMHSSETSCFLPFSCITKHFITGLLTRSRASDLDAQRAGHIGAGEALAIPRRSRRWQPRGFGGLIRRCDIQKQPQVFATKHPISRADTTLGVFAAAGRPAGGIEELCLCTPRLSKVHDGAGQGEESRGSFCRRADQ